MKKYLFYPLLVFAILYFVSELSYANVKNIDISDDFPRNTLLNLKESQESYKNNLIISDDNFMSFYINSLKNLQEDNYYLNKQDNSIEDDFINTFKSKIQIDPIIVNNSVIQDDFIQNISKCNSFNESYYTNNSFVDTLDSKELLIKSSQYVSTKNNLLEGKILKFTVCKPIQIDKYYIDKGTSVLARIENISLNQSFGTPASIIISNFQLPEFPTINIEGSINKTGANRSLWVYPVGSSFLPFFGLGALVYTIRGGHAKIYTSEIFKVYAH